MFENQSPWQAFLSFIVVLALSLFSAALLSPLAFHAVSALGPFPLHRVFNRIAILVFLALTYFLLRRARLADRATLGYGTGGAAFVRQAVVGFTAGFALMGAAAAPLFALGLRILKPSHAALASMLQLLPGGIATGLAVALIEETFFRGAMYGAIRRRAPARVAIATTSGLYAAVHFLGERTHLAPTDVDWASGFVLLANFFAAYQHPLAFADAFIALVAVGALLALVRERLGDVAACVGLHAGFVTVILCVRRASVAIQQHPLSWLISDFDGVVGWLVAVLAAAASCAYLLVRARHVESVGSDVLQLNQTPGAAQAIGARQRPTDAIPQEQSSGKSGGKSGDSGVKEGTANRRRSANC
jgi:uncharacterized protein